MAEKIWTASAIEEYCTELCEDFFGIDFKISVEINPRLTRVLGRVRFTREYGNYYPTLMEFSKSYLECATNESIEDVIKHELCHYVATEITGENHGHDAYFKRLCKKIGCKNDGVAAKKAEYNKPMPKKNPKYVVECTDCGGKSYYYRKCKVTTYINRYHCGKCGCKKLTVVCL